MTVTVSGTNSLGGHAGMSARSCPYWAGQHYQDNCTNVGAARQKNGHEEATDLINIWCC